jgi:hypothetical protein
MRICFDHLIEGCESLKATQHVNNESGLKSLTLFDMEAMTNPSFHKQQCRLVRSLEGLPNLKYLNIMIACNTSEIPTILGEEVLLHSDCKIQTLDLSLIKGQQDNDTNEAELDAPDQIGARLDRFFFSLQQNTSICQLFFWFGFGIIAYPAPAINNLFKVALSPRKDFRRIRLSRVDQINKLDDLSNFVSVTENMDVSQPHQCKIRRFNFLEESLRMFANGDAERRKSNIQCAIHLLSKRLPYLYDIVTTYAHWTAIKQGLVGQGLVGQEELENWNKNWLCLERNRVGVALLHPSVAPSVPTSFWPTVLARTTSKMGDSTTGGWQKEDNPLDCLFPLVRGLFMGGHLTKHRKQTKPSPSSEDRGADDQKPHKGVRLER